MKSQEVLHQLEQLSQTADRALSGLEADRILLVSTPEEAKRVRAAQNKTV